MGKKHFSEEQIAFALRQAESGTSVAEVTRNLVITRKNTIEKVVEIDPEAAEWTRRGAEMIAYEGKSAVDVARLFNEHKVGGKQTWSDGRVRQHFGREKLNGKDVFRKTKQVIDRQTGKKKVVHLPASEWIWRDVPHLRILSDDLADAVHRKLGLGAESFGRKANDHWKKACRAELYPKVLARPACGCCGNPMILGRSVGKYQSFLLLQCEQRNPRLYEPGLQIGPDHRRGGARGRDSRPSWATSSSKSNTSMDTKTRRWSPASRSTPCRLWRCWTAADQARLPEPHGRQPAASSRMDLPVRRSRRKWSCH